MVHVLRGEVACVVLVQIPAVRAVGTLRAGVTLGALGTGVAFRALRTGVALRALRTGSTLVPLRPPVTLVALRTLGAVRTVAIEHVAGTVVVHVLGVEVAHIVLVQVPAAHAVMTLRSLRPGVTIWAPGTGITLRALCAR